MDNWSKEKRSRVMSTIRSKNTKPEKALRSALHRKGYRYRLHCKQLPGQPDIVLPRYKTVIFVNGCFWHAHQHCGAGRIPKSNVEFWRRKIQANQQRDRRNLLHIWSMGWKVLVVWECEIKKRRMEQVLERIKEACLQNVPYAKASVQVKVYEAVEGDMAQVADELVPLSPRRRPSVIRPSVRTGGGTEGTVRKPVFRYAELYKAIAETSNVVAEDIVAYGRGQCAQAEPPDEPGVSALSAEAPTYLIKIYEEVGGEMLLVDKRTVGPPGEGFVQRVNKY